jgi:cytochrome c oxidase subunit 3
VLFGFLMWGTVLFQWFRDAIARAKGGQYSRASTLVPLEHELVHLLGGDVLRRLLRRAVLGRVLRAADAGQPRPPDPVARLQGRLAVGRPGHHRLAGRHVEAFTTMGPWPIPTINTALLLSSGVTLTIAHHALIAGHRAKTVPGCGSP